MVLCARETGGRDGKLSLAVPGTGGAAMSANERYEPLPRAESLRFCKGHDRHALEYAGQVSSATDGTVGASRRAGGSPKGMDDAINLLSSPALPPII
jgi:hypothetical protein